MSKTVLQGMCQSEPNERIRLSDAQEVCAVYSSRYSRGTLFLKCISKLHKEVLGGLLENDNLIHSNQVNFMDGPTNDALGVKQIEDIPVCLSTFNYTENPQSSKVEPKMDCLSPREKWKAAMRKITEQDIGKKDLHDTVHQGFQNHEAFQSLLKLCDDFKERRKILGLMKTYINGSLHLFTDNGKASFLAKVLLPKTSSNMVLLPQQYISQQISEYFDLMDDTDEVKQTTHLQTEVCSAVQYVNSISNYYTDIPYRTYYSIQDIALRKSCPWKTSRCEDQKLMSGPEFILRSLKPHAELTIPGDRSFEEEDTENPVCCIFVVAPNGERIIVTCSITVTAAQIFLAIIQHLAIQEHYLFGLAYIQDHEFLFVDGKQKLAKIIPSSTLSDSHELEDQRTFTLHLRVKFYVEDMNAFTNLFSRHLLYLQLRRNLLDEFTHCNCEKSIIVGGLALQAEFGDYYPKEHGSSYFLVEHYMPYRSVKQLGRHIAKEKLHEEHMSHAGMSTDIAELRFIQEVQSIDEYGCNFHKVLQDKRNPMSAVWLVVSSKGVDVYENAYDERKKCKEYPWSRIKRISFTKKYFCLSPKAESSCGKHVTYKFYAPFAFKSQYLFHLTVAHHRFFVKLKSKANMSGTFLEDVDADQSLCGEMSEWPMEIGVEHEIGFDIHPNEHESMVPSLSKKARYVGKMKTLHSSIITHTLPLRTMFISEKLPSPLIFMKPLSLSKYRMSIVQRKLYTCCRVRRSSSAPAEYGKLRSEEERFFNGFSLKNGIHASGTMPRTSCKKTEIKMVRLIKDKNCGLGLTITCGDTYDTVLHGAFVELITPAGPADHDGNLSAGDQILAVNGIDVQNDHFLDVADLLQQCSSPVELVIGKPYVKINAVRPDTFISKTKDKVDEPPCIKAKTWWSDKPTETKTSTSLLSYDIEDSVLLKNRPIPNPRRKWSEKESSSVINSSTLNNIPDLTVETCTRHTEQKENVEEDRITEMDCSIISEHMFRGKDTIPDIIPSQVANSGTSDSDLLSVSNNWDYLNKVNEESKLYSETNTSPGNLNTSVQVNEDSIIRNEKMDILTAGDVYHIVLDKRGGSLGLNIFQGKDPSYPSQRNIYVYSLIPGGAAETDNRIKPGDKLLEVNGILLEKLSYNDVVNTLRESPQVTHLVLERGIPGFPNTVEESLNDHHSSTCLKVSEMKRKVTSESAINKKNDDIQNNHRVSFMIAADGNSLSENEYIHSTVVKETNDFTTNKNATLPEGKPKHKHNLQFSAFDKCVNNMETNSLPNVLTKNLRNSLSLNSLPSASSDILHIESGFSDSITEYTKDISGSAPYLNKSNDSNRVISEAVSQCQNSVLHPTHNSSSNYFTCCSDISFRSAGASDECTSPNHTKGFSHSKNGLSSSVESISKSVLYRSTPNLTANMHNEQDNFHSHFHYNKSTDCLSSDGIKEDSSSELHKDFFVRSFVIDINQVPKAPLRKKKLKRLEDILNYSNSENTFDVTIRKSSRGLGLSISGGCNAHRNETEPLSQLISIRKLYPLQPALECGKLAIGDIILEVNQTSMIGLSNTEALEVLRSASITVKLKIFRPPKSLSFLTLQDVKWKFPGDSQSSSASSSLSKNEARLYTSYCEESGEFVITLIKREGSLGFTVSRKESQDGVPLSGIYVKSLIKEPALSDGRIHPGDRIVQVNGTDISSMSHAEAITFLRNAPESVMLKLFRCNPPLSPSYTDDYPTSKPLRWEAVELLNDRVKHKDNEISGERKAKRRLKKCAIDSPNNSSSESESSLSASGQEHIISNCPMDLEHTKEKHDDEAPGLQRNQRPKSLDVLNTSDRKQRMSDVTDDENFHRQASVIGNPVNLKISCTEDTCDGAATEKGGKALLKWRGSTLPSEDSVSDTEIFSSFSKFEDHNYLSGANASTEQNISDFIPESDNSVQETATIVQQKEPWIRTFDVELDRKWYGRLGFSLCDSPPDDGSPRTLLPKASEVKAVHPGSLAAKDGRIAVGDRLVEVNSESVLGKSAAEIIDMMRKLTGLIKMVFCRLEAAS